MQSKIEVSIKLDIYFVEFSINMLYLMMKIYKAVNKNIL